MDLLIVRFKFRKQSSVQKLLRLSIEFEMLINHAFEYFGFVEVFWMFLYAMHKNKKKSAVSPVILLISIVLKFFLKIVVGYPQLIIKWCEHISCQRFWKFKRKGNSTEVLTL